MTPETANQIFDFMKQKRIEIQKRQTKEELEALKSDILEMKGQNPTEVKSPSSQDSSGQMGSTATNPENSIGSTGAPNS